MTSNHFHPRSSQVRRSRRAALLAALLALALPLVAGAAEVDPKDFAALMAKKSDLSQETIEALLAGQSQEILVTIRPAEGGAQRMLFQSVDEQEGLQGQLEYHAALMTLGKEKVLGDLAKQDMTFETVREYDHLPIVALQVEDAVQAQALALNPGVQGLNENRWFEKHLVESKALINWAAADAFVSSYSMELGHDTSVVVIDTGVDYKHPSFGTCTAPGDPGCAVSYARDFAPDDGARDDDGHGTNVAAIVHGVAPGTKIIALDVFRWSNGRFGADFADILDALNWTVRNTYWHKIVAVNLSLGSPRQFNWCSSDLSSSGYYQAFDLLRWYGIIPVVSSGNDANASYLSEPGCSSKALSVGSVTDDKITDVSFYTGGICAETLGTPKDTVSCFSNGGQELDLLAPGDRITAGGWLAAGTSQAAPHVAGAVAALRSFYRWEHVDETIERLVQSGKPITDPRNGITYPRLDLGAAINIDACDINPLAPGCQFTRIDCGRRYDGPLCDHFREEVLDLCIIHPEICAEPWPTIPLLDFDPGYHRGRRFGG